MNVLQNPEFFAGMLTAAIVIGAAYGSSIFRNLGLAALAGFTCFVFIRFGGVAGVVVVLKALKLDLTTHHVFTQGAAVGAAVTVALLIADRQPRQS